MKSIIYSLVKQLRWMLRLYPYLFQRICHSVKCLYHHNLMAWLYSLFSRAYKYEKKYQAVNFLGGWQKPVPLPER